jgi:hypothetical protein
MSSFMGASGEGVGGSDGGSVKFQMNAKTEQEGL